MVYTALQGNQTERYPHVKDLYRTTNQHFHDSPTSKEPLKASTFGKLYENSPYFLDRRLDQKPPSRAATVGGGTTSLRVTGELPPPRGWSGRLSSLTYRGNGTFELANGMTYSAGSSLTRSSKPVRLVPYADLQKTEYQDHYNRTAVASEHPNWVSGRAPYSVQYKSTGRFAGL
ncbi:hypothetical protein PLESTB_001059700 [Pleodorina starrii]|uniref:Uncharacterized protein n=1 Tax=Pleodorina starrii TaxID=330485 RepID=A0A9W6F508_9CHLO|nr:hypothetical protein PLESTM_001277400 [Pleodorina starrii]GLC56055.1 hypothetical protein PLESTB_001059700 [Pleodorina starrii]GLC64038.1 hypothetical protein PLESTF_000111600 [Pleodorina starrii]